MKRKPILCLDFDGVLHSYESGWQGAGKANDPPVPGALEFLHEATRHFRVMIYSSRSKSLAGRAAMKRYVREHFDLSLTFSPDHEHDWLHEAIEYPWFKPPALLTIDDRALTFDGTWPSMAALQSFQPWNKRRGTGGEDVTQHGSICRGSADTPSGVPATEPKTSQAFHSLNQGETHDA